MGPVKSESALLTLRLEGMGRLGEALAQHDGRPVFVFGGIPGEGVLAEVVRRWRSHIAARVAVVNNSSPQRVVALPVCTLLHLMYQMGIHPTLNPDWMPPGGCPDCHHWARALNAESG